MDTDRISVASKRPLETDATGLEDGYTVVTKIKKNLLILLMSNSWVWQRTQEKLNLRYRSSFLTRPPIGPSFWVT